MNTRASLSLTLALLLPFGAQSLSGKDLAFDEGLRGHLAPLTDHAQPGIAVLVARDGQVIFQDGFGFADLEHKTPVTTATKFRIGSVTKQFIAAAVLRLSEEGKLALTDKLEKFLLDLPGGGSITLLQLLNHTSGIHSYTNKPEFLTRVTKPIAPADLIAWIRDDKPDFAPGAGFAYNNSAYFLAGEIVAKVSGESLDAHLRRVFFGPLEMKDTGIYLNSAPPAGAARGYTVLEKNAEPALEWDMSWAGGAGALYSTVGDLFRWNEALYGGRVLKPESLKLMTTPAKLPPGVDGMSYGLGLVTAPISRLPATSHSGGLNGWSSDLVRVTGQHCTVVALANALPAVPGCEPTSVTRHIVERLLAAEIKKLPPPVEDPKIDPKTYPDFAGRYDYQSAVLTVTVENNRLYSQLTGQPKFEIFPSGPGEFFWKVTDAQVTFVRNEKGEVTAARHAQNGSTFTAPRQKESALKLTAADLAPLVGQYQYGPAVMTVSRDGDTLFAQLTGQPKFQIFPKSPTEFEWRVVPASVAFVKGPDGKVTKAVHTQNGRTFDAPRK